MSVIHLPTDLSTFTRPLARFCRKCFRNKMLIKDKYFVRPWRIELQPEHWQCPDLPLIDDRNFLDFFSALFILVFYLN